MADNNSICGHLEAITELKFPVKHECSECMKTGGNWVHLRTCQACGETLCCDSSPNKHMSKHAAEKGHPVAISAEPKERWLWCFKDKQMAEY
ncbi:UBP-type zinc finger domain-containing protein [Dyadobacter subterraneus]|uniref:UBP-type zinc finger domain-containing protein n=1 Tax=Dyadobacter subterraneus TaxID=2773304 RepID=A0ABR9WCG1_9BACT|nr:UBP-type zinc finger domain-containing protein [Dyadobacter subterraneus]MBE9461929.1 UBP-type zinc finger domain-containing protein [Dyadobacter subterraneus]